MCCGNAWKPIYFGKKDDTTTSSTTEYKIENEKTSSSPSPVSTTLIKQIESETPQPTFGITFPSAVPSRFTSPSTTSISTTETRTSSTPGPPYKQSSTTTTTVRVVKNHRL